ncbi:Hypothetical protein ORPV_231, partial [Orpheovirus IHUMI-LCC2]
LVSYVIKNNIIGKMSQAINVCNTPIFGRVALYARVDVRTGNDNTGQVGPATFTGGGGIPIVFLSPFRTLQAAANALDRSLRGNSTLRGMLGEAIILNGTNRENNTEYITGDLIIPDRILVATETFFPIPIVNVTGTLYLSGNNNISGVTFNVSRLVTEGSVCTRGIFLSDNATRGQSQYPFIQVKNGHLGLEDSTISTIYSSELFDITNSELALVGCNISEKDGKIGFDLHNSKAYLSNCKINLQVDVAVKEEGNSSFYITKSDLTIEGDDVVLNDLSNCNQCQTEYDRTFINILSKSAKDINTGNKIKYNFDTFTGNFDGLLNNDTSEYSVISDNGIISSNSSKVLRCISEYNVLISDQYLVFKHSEDLIITLPNNAYNGKALSMKFIDVQDRKIKGRFDRNDVEKIKKLDIINLVYINNAWYLM